MPTVSELRELVATPEFRAEAEAKFFAAMQLGWAFDGGVSGASIIYGPWRVTDKWTSNGLGRYSAGRTQIFYDAVLVWEMHYSGWYAEDAIPCLKEGLRRAYADSKFIGGRGEVGSDHDGMTYCNYPDRIHNNFGLFRGEEHVIRRRDLERMGFHWYHGMFLLDSL